MLSVIAVVSYYCFNA